MDFMFVLVLQDDRVPRVRCFTCQLYPISLYLTLLQTSDLYYNPIHIEDLPIRYIYSRQLQKFEPIPDKCFDFRHLYAAPLFPTDINHRGFPVTVMTPGGWELDPCQVLMYGIHAHYKSNYLPTIKLCAKCEEEAAFMASILNLTLYRDFLDPHISLQFLISVDAESGMAGRMRWDNEVQAFVKYCRPYNRFQSSLWVWLTPFNINVWIGIFLTFVVITTSTRESGKIISKPSRKENISRYITTWLSSSYFLFSLLLREPIRKFSRRYVTFVGLTLIISWAYEGCITTNIIAPAKPFRYENVGQFINSSQKVVVFAARLNLPGHIDAYNPVFFMELKKFGVSGGKVIEKFFHIIRHITTSYIFNYGLGQGKNVSDIGYLDSRIRSIVSSSMERMQIEMNLQKIEGQHDAYKCHQFPFGHVKMAFASFKFALARKAIILHNVLLESGISAYSDRITDNEFRLDSAKIEREAKTNVGRESYILLKHLRAIFELHVTLLSAFIVIFVFEKWVCFPGVLVSSKLLVMRMKLALTKSRQTLKKYFCRRKKQKRFPKRTNISRTWCGGS
ncbi:hypothetical protein Fcan01_19129 [Folsomia candida]|uniref:Uncharacterized protein n=1 Tax=Folsomia candida TaxID=158441 RepID=A0A226DN20_FOLCA|nr:hypothetical protein Fcan01_19129 [Folsomia candida]